MGVGVVGWFSFEDQTKIRNIDITQMLHVGHVSLQNWLICEEHGDTYSSYSMVHMGYIRVIKDIKAGPAW